jgi:hypothetical protein
MSLQVSKYLSPETSNARSGSPTKSCVSVRSPARHYGAAHATVQPAPESSWDTVKRNLTPQLDTSRSALGAGHEFDAGPSPQQQGEEQYRESFGSPLERAYGHAKRFLAEHEQHLSDRVLKPFREGPQSHGPRSG